MPGAAGPLWCLLEIRNEKTIFWRWELRIAGDFDESPSSMASWATTSARFAVRRICPTHRYLEVGWGGAIGAWILSPAQVDALNPKP